MDAQERLNAQKKLLKGCNREIGEAHAERTQLVKDMSKVQLHFQELEHKVNKCNKDTNDAARLVYILSVQHHFGSEGEMRWKGGAMVLWVEHWTCDQQVVGSNPTRGKAV